MNLLKTAQSIIKDSLPDELATIDHAWKETDYHHPNWDDVEADLYFATEDVDFLYDTFGKDYDNAWSRICKAVVDELKESDWYKKLYQDELSNKYS